MPTTKTYTPLSSLPGKNPGKCAQILPNRCQCWRSGDNLVEETISEGRVTEYWLCSLHTIVQQNADALEVKAEAEADEKAKVDSENLKASAPPTGTSPAPASEPEPPKEPVSNVVQTPTGAISSPPEESFHEKMLKAVQGSQTVKMPQGEDSPNNQ